jgi:hypothetical protein
VSERYSTVRFLILSQARNFSTFGFSNALDLPVGFVDPSWIRKIRNIWLDPKLDYRYSLNKLSYFLESADGRTEHISLALILHLFTFLACIVPVFFNLHRLDFLFNKLIGIFFFIIHQLFSKSYRI